MRFTSPFSLSVKSLFILLFLVSGANSNAKPLVISSIKPLQLLVAAVAEDLVDTQLLLPGTVSPHLYHLRPSDRQRLQSADLIVWVGPDLERFLVKTLSLLPKDQALELGGVLGGRDVSAGTDKHHDHGRPDPHLWLNPVYAVQMAQMIADRLMDIDPNNRLTYRRNWEQFRERIYKIDRDISTQFNSISNQAYVVLHDGYGHFEQRYGVTHVAALTVSPERKPGVKSLLKIKEKIQSHGVRCLFRESQYQLAIEKIFYDNSDITVGLLDPLASITAVSITGYEEFLLSFSAEFQRCLARPEVLSAK